MKYMCKCERPLVEYTSSCKDVYEIIDSLTFLINFKSVPFVKLDGDRYVYEDDEGSTENSLCLDLDKGSTDALRLVLLDGVLSIEEEEDV